MKKKTILYLLLYPICMSVHAQKIDHTVSYRDMGAVQYARFSYDNDFFTATDKNYTQGYSFEFGSPFFRKNPINKLFFKPKNYKNNYGLAWEHIGFTPANIQRAEIQYGDRPFASAFMLKSFIVANSEKKKNRFTSAFSIGVIGPIAFGEWMQVEIHKATGNIIPQGWQNQIRNHAVFNYEAGFEKQLLSLGNYLSVLSYSKARFGTLFTDATVGASVQIGLINSPFQPTSKKKLQLYLYAQPVLTGVAYDATLQGGLFTQNDQVYTIKSRQVARFRKQADVGLILKIKGMYFEYSQAIQSKDFAGAKSYRWGGFKAGFTF